MSTCRSCGKTHLHTNIYTECEDCIAYKETTSSSILYAAITLSVCIVAYGGIYVFCWMFL